MILTAPRRELLQGARRYVKVGRVTLFSGGGVFNPGSW